MTIRAIKLLTPRPASSGRPSYATLMGVLLGSLCVLSTGTVYAQALLPGALLPAALATTPIEASLAPPPSLDAPVRSGVRATSIVAEGATPTSTNQPGASPLPTTTSTTSTTTASPPDTASPPLTVSTSSSSDSTPPVGNKSAVDHPAPNSVMPLDPPPLPQESRLDNAIRNEAERSFYDAKKQKYQTTFERAYEGLVPLGPNEVRDTMSRYERTQRASVPPSTGQPRGQVRIKTLSLEPGSEPPTVNISSGYVTTITILDATGEPWPILDLGIGGNFEVSKTGGGNHVIRIMPLTRFGYGNLSVLLQDLSTPIIFKLSSGGATVDYRFDARIPRLGPNAKLSLIDKKNKLQAGSAEIMGFLDNAPPPEAKRVRINGADSRTMAWTVDRRMFVRTPLTMLSPAWDSSVSSADGTTVYELTETPVLIMSDNGVLVRARVAPKEEE